jgi:AAA+ superfamily predicted ATPase
MKLDSKFEERIKYLLEKYAIHDNIQNILLNLELNESKIFINIPDKNMNESEILDHDDEDDDDNYEDIDDDEEDNNKEDDKEEDNKDNEKYYFYYKILSKNDISDNMEDIFEDEIDHLNAISKSDNQENSKNDQKVSNKKIAVIYFYDEELEGYMQEICDIPSLYETESYLTMTNLFYCINNLRLFVNNPENSENKLKLLSKVLNFVEELFVDNIKKMDKMIANDLIDFNSLWYYFDKPNKLYIVKHLNDEEICFRHDSFTYDRMESIDCFYMNGYILTIYKKKIYKSSFSHVIKKFKGAKPIKNFEIKNMTTELENNYIDNADKIIKLYDGIHHMNLKGKQYFKRRQEIVNINRNERVIVDHEGGEQLGDKIPYYFSEEDIIETDDMTKEDKLITYPYISVYNLGTNKIWGIAHVNTLSSIIYNKEAFDYLVLDKKKKDMILGLIKNYKDSVEDFIATKGRGLIFLLYGPPGVGKTLSSEATCEILEKPLYAINIGDLGTHPDVMESQLESINEYVKRWNAIILIDEVDIFLENREYSDITRNAMVCIFLKFLEYHESIIFLTTNRLKNIDPAIKSRINLFLAYNELDGKMRKEVWSSLLKKSNITVNDKTLNEISENKINGREIRNYLKLIVSIHKQKNIEISDKSFISTLKDCFELAGEFNNSMKQSMYI